MQAAQAKFSRWMQFLIVLFIVIAVYLGFADRLAPLTTESQVQGKVVQIAPQVSGLITAVHIKNNQTVNAGELLFTIDDSQYKLALQQARIGLLQAKAQESSLAAQVAAAQANVTQASVAKDNSQREYSRLFKLSKTGSVSQSQLDLTQTKYQESQANLLAAQQKLQSLKLTLGQGHGQSNGVKQAENKLQQAKLNLSYTHVTAPVNGVVTNVQLYQGSFAHAQQPLLTFIPLDSMWIAADYREKATSLMHQGMQAGISFDALPGQVFKATVASRDYGVASAQQTANGQLSQVVVSNRWVRDAQRVRVNLTLDKPMPKQLFIGSKATVVIYNEQQPLMAFFGKITIHLISWLHFIY